MIPLLEPEGGFEQASKPTNCPSVLMLKLQETSFVPPVTDWKMACAPALAQMVLPAVKSRT